MGNFWTDLRGKVDVFFDEVKKWMIFRTGPELYIVFLERFNDSLKTRINCDDHTPVLAATLHHTSHLVAYQISSTVIILHNPRVDRTTAKNEVILDIAVGGGGGGGAKQKAFILKFEWIYNSPNQV